MSHAGAAGVFQQTERHMTLHVVTRSALTLAIVSLAGGRAAAQDSAALPAADEPGSKYRGRDGAGHVGACGCKQGHGSEAAHRR